MFVLNCVDDSHSRLVAIVYWLVLGGVARSCVDARLVSLGFPFLCWVNPVYVAHTVLLRPGLCTWFTRIAYGRVTRKFSAELNFKQTQTQMRNLFTLFWVRKSLLLSC